MPFRYLWIVLGLAMLGTGASAEDGKWLRAEGSRFIVYSRERESVVRDAVADLETYDETLRISTGLKDPPSGPKPEIYLLRNRGELDTAFPGMASDVAGLYIAGPDLIGALAIFRRGESKATLDGMETLFHEYAHHFMRLRPAVYPAWYVEGFAEYFAATLIKDDRVETGLVPAYRAAGLVLGRWLPLQTVLFVSGGELKEEDRSQFYGQSWLLTHYLYDDEARLQKLLKYLDLMNEGTAPEEAFRAGFGMEVGELDKALHAYAQGKLAGHWNPRPSPAGATVTVSRLPRSYDDLLLLDFLLRRGVQSELREKTLARVREKGAPYVGDPFAERVLARAEIMAGLFEAADQRADAALAAAPNDPDWLYLKGFGFWVKAAETPAERAALYRQARKYLGPALQARRTHVPSLYRYATSFMAEPAEPSENTTDLLHEAYMLAPQVDEIVISTAYALMKRTDYVYAARLLKTVAYQPHGGRASEAARSLLHYAMRKEPPPETAGGETAQ